MEKYLNSLLMNNATGIVEQPVSLPPLTQRLTNASLVRCNSILPTKCWTVVQGSKALLNPRGKLYPVITWAKANSKICRAFTIAKAAKFAHVVALLAHSVPPIGHLVSFFFTHTWQAQSWTSMKSYRTGNNTFLPFLIQKLNAFVILVKIEHVYQTSL